MYFVRFVRDEEYACNDRGRGYSFSDYVLGDTPEEVAEHFGLNENEYVVADYGDNPRYYLDRGITAIAPISPAGEKWGVMLGGLCGFGPFDTIEEAEAYALEKRGYNGVEWPCAAIFEGNEVYDPRVWDGACFRPKRIVKIIN